MPRDATLDVELRLAAEPIEVEPLRVTVSEVRDRWLEQKGLDERSGVGEKLGLGHYFDREDIERRRPRIVTEFIADVPSLRLDCTHSYRSRSCWPPSVRTPRSSCLWMNVYLDGIRVIESVHAVEY